MSFPYDLGHDLLTSAVAVLSDPPGYQIVTVGQEVPHDCEMVAVFVRRLYPSVNQFDAQGQPIVCVAYPVLELCIEVVRCYPMIEGNNLPTTAEIDAATLVVLDDMQDLYCGLLERKDAGTLFPSDPECMMVGMDDVIATDPSGGFVATRLCMRVQGDCRPQGS